MHCGSGAVTLGGVRINAFGQTLHSPTRSADAKHHAPASR
jgi:hypothetical protein